MTDPCPIPRCGTCKDLQAKANAWIRMVKWGLRHSRRGRLLSKKTLKARGVRP